MASTSTDLFDAYFRRADLDGDGKISGAEAVAFFQGSGLPKQVLAQVWTYANQKNAAYLDRQDFYNALKLVTVAQRKRDLTPDIVKAALFSTASAKIPAPQINLSAILAPSGGGGGGGGVRPPQPQVSGNAGMNPQYVASQQNQYMRQQQQQPQVGPPGTASHPQQLVGSQTTPMTAQVGPPGTASHPQQLFGSQTTPMTAPPRASNPSGWSVGSMSRQISQVPSQPITPPGLDGFGMTGSASVQPRLQVNSGQMVSTPSKPQDMATSSNPTVSKDSKGVGVSGNGFPSDSLFGDVFSPAPAQPKPSFPPTTSSANTVTVSSSPVPSSVGPQSSVKPNSVNSSQSTLPQQPFGGHSTGRQNLQNAMPSSSSGVPGGAVNLASSPSQPSWPKMTPSNIQNYLKVFVQVDHDRDGKISGEQARNLFLSWRLPREALKKIWDLSDQDNDSMLSLREFCIALYLMELFREGHPLPLTLPSSITSDEVLLSATNYPAALNGSGAWGSAPGMRQPQVMTGTRPTAAAARPPRPPIPHPVPHTEEKQPPQHKPKVPVLEKHLLYQLSQGEQDSLNSKFQDASQADKKVEDLEKEISDSRQKIEFYRSKMQELILYKSRVDNRLNEVSERVSADKCEVETLSKKYEEKYRQSGDVASKLTIEEATFHDIQEKKMDLYRAIIKMEEGETAEGVIKERSEQIQSSLEELVKSVNERCKQYGLRAKPTSLLELPFGWQPGIQEGTADWDEDWDKFEDEGFTTVKELTLDVQNVVAPAKQKSSDVEVTSEQVSSPNKPHEKESAQDRKENGVVKSPPESPAGRSAVESQSHIFRDSPVGDNASADGSPHAREIQSNVGDKNVDEPGWGKFDSQYDTDSVWGTDSLSGKDFDHGLGEFGLNPIRTGPSHEDKMSKGKSSSIFADSVPGTPAYNQVKSSFPFADSVPSTSAYSQGKSSFACADSVPSTPAYNQGKNSYAFADTVPSTPAYNQGKNSYAFGDSVPSTPAYNTGRSSFPFADSVPGTPAYNFGNSPRRFSDGTEDHSFDSFSRLDSLNMNDTGLFQSSGPPLSRFDPIGSTRDADQSYGFSTRFDSFRESGDYDQSQGFSRFDSFRETDQGHGLSRFDSFRETDYSNGFPSNLDSSGETRDSDNNHAFSRFDSFRSHDGGFGQPPANSGSDPVHGFRDSDTRNGFPSFDDTDPFGSNVPFRTSVESETPRKSTDDWRAF